MQMVAWIKSNEKLWNSASKKEAEENPSKKGDCEGVKGATAKPPLILSKSVLQRNELVI